MGHPMKPEPIHLMVDVDPEKRTAATRNAKYRYRACYGPRLLESWYVDDAPPISHNETYEIDKVTCVECRYAASRSVIESLNKFTL